MRTKSGWSEVKLENGGMEATGSLAGVSYLQPADQITTSCGLQHSKTAITLKSLNCNYNVNTIIKANHLALAIST